MHFQFIAPVAADQLRKLPTRDVALLLLKYLAEGGGFVQYVSTMGAAQKAFHQEPDADRLVHTLSDAWSWLEANALLSREPSQSDGFRRISRDGRDLAMAPEGIARFEARERLSGSLHPALEGGVRTNFELGDYETACFAAMKAVEVAVRDASGLDNSLVGVKLMRMGAELTASFSSGDGRAQPWILDVELVESLRFGPPTGHIDLDVATALTLWPPGNLAGPARPARDLRPRSG